MQHIKISQLSKKTGISKQKLTRLLSTNWTVETLAAAASLHPRYVRSLLNHKIPAVRVGRDWTITRAAGDVWLEGRGITVETPSSDYVGYGKPERGSE